MRFSNLSLGFGKFSEAWRVSLDCPEMKISDAEMADQMFSGLHARKFMKTREPQDDRCGSLGTCSDDHINGRLGSIHNISFSILNFCNCIQKIGVSCLHLQESQRERHETFA